MPLKISILIIWLLPLSCSTYIFHIALRDFQNLSWVNTDLTLIHKNLYHMIVWIQRSRKWSPQLLLTQVFEAMAKRGLETLKEEEKQKAAAAKKGGCCCTISWIYIHWFFENTLCALWPGVVAMICLSKSDLVEISKPFWRIMLWHKYAPTVQF